MRFSGETNRTEGCTINHYAFRLLVLTYGTCVWEADIFRQKSH